MDQAEFDRQIYVARWNRELGIITRNQYLEIHQDAFRGWEEERNRTFPMSERQELTKAILASRSEPAYPTGFYTEYKHPDGTWKTEPYVEDKAAELYFEVTGRGTVNGTLDHYSKWDYSDWREEYLATGQSYAFDKMLELYDGSELPKPVTKTVNPFDKAWNFLGERPGIPVLACLVVFGYIAMTLLAAL